MYVCTNVHTILVHWRHRHRIYMYTHWTHFSLHVFFFSIKIHRIEFRIEQTANHFKHTNHYFFSSSLEISVRLMLTMVKTAVVRMEQVQNSISKWNLRPFLIRTNCNRRYPADYKIVIEFRSIAWGTWNQTKWIETNKKAKHKHITSCGSLFPIIIKYKWGKRRNGVKFIYHLHPQP